MSGRPSLHTPDGWRNLEEGEIVAFPRGEAGAAERPPGGGSFGKLFRIEDEAEYYDGEQPPSS